MTVTTKDKGGRPNLRVLGDRTKGVPFENAIVLAEGVRGLVPLKRLFEAIEAKWSTAGKSWCWTGTMTAYREHGKKLGDEIRYVDPKTGHEWVFPVPKDHRGERDAILVVEPPDYEVVTDGNRRIVQPSSEDLVDLVDEFPGSECWVRRDPIHGMATVKKMDTSKDKWLLRTGLRVGPAAATTEPDGKRYINVFNRPSVEYCAVALDQ